jgi:HEAT repeat protein
VRGVPAAVLGALVRAETAETRRDAAYALEILSLERDSAPAVLLPLLAPLLADADEDVREAAATAVRVSGSEGR